MPLVHQIAKEFNVRGRSADWPARVRHGFVAQVWLKGSCDSEYTATLPCHGVLLLHLALDGVAGRAEVGDEPTEAAGGGPRGLLLPLAFY
jgi:hypothetical protein